ncbi:TPR-containing protein DDB_G0280363-like isoform X1 [Sander lucioperca]|uniref:TPR-containing protein DDB_G0280363-like isoform X1 n=1 Tax=Sander lucioperca TaxID=283035 RepID=UPI00125D78BE|nr:TPR-containing protein DDB_G0280363-like isoform X1 [Sander lucioperca]
MDPVRRKSCLRLRGNCPIRKLLRRTYDVSAANSSPIGSYWNYVAPPTGSQPITERSQPLPHPCCCQRVSSSDQSEAAADVPMEETQQNQTHNQTQQTQQNQTHNQTQQNQTHNQTHNQTQGNQTQQTQQNQTQQTQTQGNPEARAVDFMDLDDDVDPETGEKSQG